MRGPASNERLRVLPGHAPSPVRLGFVVNPLAGLGGSAGLKGTDGPGIAAEAIRRGAVPQSAARARLALERLAATAPGTALRAGPGALGADVAAGLPLRVEAIDLPPLSGTARDTRLAVEAMAECDLVVFAGGDGTARDVAAALRPRQGLLGIPCGVKMQSAVFARTPEAAGHLLCDLVREPARTRWRDNAEIADLDEAALRRGIVAPRLFGIARAPTSRDLVQPAKGGGRADEGATLAAAARELAAAAPAGTLHLVGPGTSAGLFAAAVGLAPTLLGVDAVLDGRMVAPDADAATLERIAADRPVRIVLGVTGNQGFLLGRGNQQISPALLARAGREGLVVIAAEEKLLRLDPPRLWIDTGDPALDSALAGYVRVHTAPGRTLLMRIGPS